MKGLIYLFLILSLMSCAVFDKYSDNTHTWYHQSLNKEEKAALERDKKIEKEWLGTNTNGDFARGKLLVLDTDTPRFYKFVHMGTWIERHSVSAKGWKAEMKDSTIYDSYGNILYRERYLDEKNDDRGFFLFEKHMSYVSDSLVQALKYYYPNGQLKLWQVLITENPNKYDERDKQTYLDFEAAYMENGNKCDVTELEPDWYYVPGTRMKKQH